MIDRILGSAVGGLVGEIRQHPWTTLSAACALAVAGLAISTRAPADALQSVERSVNALKISTLEGALIDTRVKQCAASQDKYFRTRVAELQREYYALAGREFALPSCDELNP